MKFIFNVDSLIVRLDELRPAKIVHGELELDFANDYNLEKNARVYGEVVAVPNKLSQTVFTFEKATSADMKPIKLNQLHLEVQVGDRVYFHYIANHQDNILIEEDTGAFLLKIRYEFLLCRVRDGVIHPLSTHVLVEPETEDWDEITTDAGVITKKTPGRRPRTGRVKYVGRNYKDRNMELEPGMRIIFMKKADRIVEIEGEELYPIKYNYIEAIIPEDFILA